MKERSAVNRTIEAWIKAVSADIASSGAPIDERTAASDKVARVEARLIDYKVSASVRFDRLFAAVGSKAEEYVA